MGRRDHQICRQRPAGQEFGTTLMTAFAAGNGARFDMDGVDTGGLMLTPESEIANVETHEMFYPLLYLWRRQLPESYGLGKFGEEWD